MLVDMGVSHCGVVVADLVPDPRCAKAFTGDVSLPAGGGAACRRFCGLAHGADRFNVGIP
ncbi:hypothetical protein ES703_83849 [subsurface metagenome]